MGRKLEEVTLTFEYERIRFDNGDGPGTAIIHCRDSTPDEFGASPEIIVKVPCEPNDFVRGLDYRFYGHWTNHPKYGRQFAAKMFVKKQPHDRRGIIAYLKQAPWIGETIASQLWDRFAGDAVRIVREQPETASELIKSGFNEARAREAAKYLAQEQALENTTIDLMDLFSGRGFPRDLGKRVVAEWGNRAAELIRRNPYLLMRFRGCGFLRTDRLYLDEGGDPGRLKRQALCAWYAVASETEGHTWFRPEQVEAGLRGRISGTVVRPVAAIVLARRAKILATRRDDKGQPWVAERRKADNERTIAERVEEMLATPRQWPEAEK